MIYYFSTTEHLYTMQKFVESWKDRLTVPIEVMSYQELIRRRELERGVYIFADIERLSKGQAQVVGRIWHQLSGQVPAEALMNHPQRSMTRFELLKYAHNHRMNSYNVHRIPKGEYTGAFPMFVRRISEHSGNLTPLLNSQTELDEALAGLPKERAIRRDLMITEFCDISDAKGVYRKYSALRVGDSIVPRSIFFDTKWMQKLGGDTFADNHPYLYDELQSYLEENPHAEELMKVYQAAGLEYGRIDYGVKDGKVQVWEINTNPWTVTSAYLEREARRPYYEIFRDQVVEVFNNIPVPDPGTVSIQVSSAGIALYEVSKARWMGRKYTKKKIRAWLRSKLKPGA